MPATSAEKVSKTYVNPGQTYVLATVSIGVDGKYGEIVNKTFSTLAIPYSNDITVAFDSVSYDETAKTYTVTVSVNGATKVMGYNIKYDPQNTYNWDNFPNTVCVNGHKASYYGYEMADVVDGKATLTFSYNSYKNDYYVAAYNVTDGVVSSMSQPVKQNLF